MAAIPENLIVSFCPIGDPVYSDVPKIGMPVATEEQAIEYGARLVKVGNWHSFVVEKRYVGNATTPEVGTR